MLIVHVSLRFLLSYSVEVVKEAKKNSKSIQRCVSSLTTSEAFPKRYNTRSVH